MIAITKKYKEDLFPVPTFITDTNGITVYFNSAGKGIVRQKSLPYYEEFPFGKLLSCYNKTELPENIPAIGGNNGFILEDKSNQTVWYVQTQPIYNKFSVKLGSFYTFNSISYINRIMCMLEKYAFNDMLTGAYNRHFFDMKKESICEMCQTRMTIIMCDIDNLKKVNDNYGHTEGDVYIKACSRMIFKSVRKKDLVFRIGGDEFLIMLPDTEESTAETIVSRIHEKMDVPAYDGKFLTGLSIGYATSKVKNTDDFRSLMIQADKSMYRNKQERKVGR